MINYVDLGMNLTEALNAPTVHSAHFPLSFYQRQAYPGRVVAEGRIDLAVISQFQHRGHDVQMTEDWVHGKIRAIRYDADHGVIMGSIAPKGDIGYAIDW